MNVHVLILHVIYCVSVQYRVNMNRMNLIYSLQRILLLPELSSIEITSANSSPVKSTNELYSPNVNEGLIGNDDQYGSISSDTITANILVSELTASWTQVYV